MKPPEEYYCTNCGGTTVVTEAYCHWNPVNQCWELDTVMDGGYDYCNGCADETNGSFRPITDVKTLAQIDIKKEEANAATVVA